MKPSYYKNKLRCLKWVGPSHYHVVLQVRLVFRPKLVLDPIQLSSVGALNHSNKASCCGEVDIEAISR